MYIYIYIYIYTYQNDGPHGEAARLAGPGGLKGGAADLRTKIVDFRGSDPSIIVVLGGGILMSIGTIQEMLRQ